MLVPGLEAGERGRTLNGGGPAPPSRVAPTPAQPQSAPDWGGGQSKGEGTSSASRVSCCCFHSAGRPSSAQRGPGQGLQPLAGDLGRQSQRRPPGRPGEGARDPEGTSPDLAINPSPQRALGGVGLRQWGGKARCSSKGSALYLPGRSGSVGSGSGGAAGFGRGSYSKLGGAGREGATQAVRARGRGAEGRGRGRGARRRPRKGRHFPAPPARPRPSSPRPRRSSRPPPRPAFQPPASAEPTGLVPDPPLCPALGGAGGGGSPAPR